MRNKAEASKLLLSERTRLNHFLTAIEIALVITDLNPLVSEPIRFGSLFGAQALSHNVVVSAIVFGAVTWVLDAFGSVAVADLLAKEKAAKAIEKMKFLIKKANLSRLLEAKTNLVIDFSITLLVGTPITLMLKHLQDSKRGRRANLKLGLSLSMAAALVSAVQGGAIVAGLWHPNLLDVSLGVAAIISFFAVQKWLKTKYS